MILVIGKQGQVAQALKQIDPARVHCLSSQECDLSCPENLSTCLAPLLNTKQFEFVINAGAYTQVDKAESEVESELCWKINALSPPLLAKLCAQANIPFVHYSTDYVYGSEEANVLSETSPCKPLNFYGKSKLHADQEILKSGGRSLTLRTSWIYHSEGKNFLNTMLGLFQSRPELKVVHDQVGTPTAARDIAEMTFRLLEPLSQLKGPELLHLTNQGYMSWYDFAVLILAEIKNLGLKPVTHTLHPITTAEWPTPARRQLNSRLSLDKLIHQFGITPRTVEVALRETLLKNF